MYTSSTLIGFFATWTMGVLCCSKKNNTPNTPKNLEKVLPNKVATQKRIWKEKSKNVKKSMDHHIYGNTFFLSLGFIEGVAFFF
jgi:hypothetical protein